MTVRDAERIEYPSQTPMWLFCLSRCSANGESLRPARLRSKRWRSLDEDESTGWYTVEEKEPCSLLWSWWWRPQVYGWTRGTQKLATIFLSIYDEAPVTSHTRIRTYTHTTFHLPATPLQPPPTSSQHLCDKGNNWVTFHSITARLPASTIALP